MSALIEEQLANAIKQELFLDDGEEADLLENTGPLATFSARIDFGYALGLYGKKAKRDLNLVREIRNAFVHSHRHIDFETPEVVELCRTFYCSSSISDFKEAGARQQFTEAAIRVIQYASRNTYSRDEIYKHIVGSFPEYQEDNEEIEKKRKKRAASQPDAPVNRATT
jgi:DNA-binding MltR family transcriptional regulator